MMPKRNPKTHQLCLEDSSFEESGAHCPRPERHAISTHGRRLDDLLPGTRGGGWIQHHMHACRL